MELNKTEKQNALSIFKAVMSLTKRRLKSNYFELLKKEYDSLEYNSEYEEKLNKYLGKDVYCFLDNSFTNEWFILEDNNYVIPNICFENL